MGLTEPNPPVTWPWLTGYLVIWEPDDYTWHRHQFQKSKNNLTITLLPPVVSQQLQLASSPFLSLPGTAYLHPYSGIHLQSRRSCRHIATAACSSGSRTYSKLIGRCVELYDAQLTRAYSDSRFFFWLAAATQFDWLKFKLTARS